MRRERLHSLAVLLLVALLVSLQPDSCHAWPWSKAKLDISSAAKCRAASHGHVYKGDSIYPALQAFFKVSGPVSQLPSNTTDITTAATLIQLAVPELKLVLDPLLFLKSLPRPHGIPKLIHMTTSSKHKLAPHQILSIVSWGWFNRGYTLLLYDNDDITAYMQRFYPAFMPTYTQLKTAVEKSDAWRYHVLCGHGGVYADTDTICAQPFESWTQFNTTPEPGLLVGIENRFHSQHEAEEASYVHKIQVTQWTMASKRSHPVVCRMGAAIKAFMEEEAALGNTLEAQHGHDASILLRTGPGIWSQEVHRYLRQMGSSPEAVAEGGQVEDCVVLPQASFGCNFRYWTVDNNASFVYHMFNNSWKVDKYKVADAKKAERLQKERETTLRRRRALYPLLFIASVSAGVLLALCSGPCVLSAKRMWSGLCCKGHWRLQRPYALIVAGSSSSGSPKGSPKQSNAVASLKRKGSSHSVGQLRQPSVHLLNAYGTRKSARLLQ